MIWLFQSLIGRLKTCWAHRFGKDLFVFQSLIGRLKTTDGVEVKFFNTNFNPL